MPSRDLKTGNAGCEGLNFETPLRECLGCGVLVVGSHGNIIVLNPEAEQRLRLTAASNEVRSVENLPPPLQSVIRDARAGGRSIVERQVVLQFNGADLDTFMVTAISQPEAGAGTVVLLQDIVCSTAIEPNLRRLDRLASVGILSASMAHEIKNALVAIKTFIDLLLEKNQDAELASIVRREMERMDTIVSHMLKFAAPAQPVCLPVRLHDILDHSLRVARHRTGNKLISFERQFSASPDLLSGDDHQLEQAIVNLLLNAIEAIGQEGTLTVSTDLAEDDCIAAQLREGPPARFLRLKITDSGAGIRPEHLPRVFDPFFTTKPNGTGLGLAVTRRIIAEHNGTIQVESQPGQGTTFTILLPLTGAAS